MARKQRSLVLSDEDYENLRTSAYEEHRSMSAIVHDALCGYDCDEDDYDEDDSDYDEDDD